MTALLDRLMAALDDAVDTFLNAVVDRLMEHWVEAEPPALCGTPTKANQQ